MASTYVSSPSKVKKPEPPKPSYDSSIFSDGKDHDAAILGFTNSKLRTDPTAVTGYAYLRENGTWEYFSSAGCHGGMAYSTSKTDKVFMTATWVNATGSDEKSVEYWNFLFDRKESPWRSLLKGRSIFRAFRADGKNLVAIGMSTDSNIPFGPFMNLLVATRTPWERPFVVDFWHTLVHEYGFTKTEALYVAAHVHKNGGTIVTSSGYGHWAYDAMVTDSTFMFSNFRDGVFNTNLTRRYGDKGYGGINATWHSSNKSSFVNRLCSTRVYDGIFMKYWVQQYGPSHKFVNKHQPPQDMQSLVKKLKEMKDAGW